MNNIFEQLFQYGFHDTEIYSIDGEGLEIRLTFENGIYLLDENGKETILSKPMQVVLKINSDKTLTIDKSSNQVEKYFKDENKELKTMFYCYDKTNIFNFGYELSVPYETKKNQNN